jgi:hypothetical protein
MTTKRRTHATRSITMSRLNFDYTDKAIEQLDDLKKRLGVGSRAEVVRYAQGILNWAVQQAEQGNQLISVNSSSCTVKELSVPPLDEIRNRVTQTRTSSRR